jgi:hypothetical protein
MVIFGDVQAYVSSDGCPSEHEAHRQVPTWRYDFKKRTVTIKHLSESNQPGSVVRQFDGNIGGHPSKVLELSGNWVTAFRPELPSPRLSVSGGNATVTCRSGARAGQPSDSWSNTPLPKQPVGILPGSGSKVHYVSVSG